MFTDETIRDEEKLLEAMEKFGGSFASTIAKAWRIADSGNRQRLRVAFGDLLESYRRFIG